MTKLIVFALAAVSAVAAPLRNEPGLTGVRFYELSGGPPTASLFTPNSAEMTTRLAGNLGSGNRDFVGLPNEYYDVFYSNSDGTFNLDGEFITIEANYNATTSSGLNIAEVELVFGGSSQFATQVTAFVPGGSNYVPANLLNIIDGNTSTSTAMGLTGAADRMSVTVGFASTPEPSSWLLGATGLGWCLLRRRKVAV